MRDQFTSHRAAHPLAEYVAQQSLEQGYFDDEEGLPDGSFIGRIGKRVLIIDSQGFLYLHQYADVAEAKTDYDMYTISEMEDMEYDDEDMFA
jgi:hypothetical protein